MRAVVYARVSTEHEAQINALENQLEWYKIEASRHSDWEIIEVYVDQGITGTQAQKRPEFLRMMEDARKGKFDLIITREVSRFARNTVDALSYTRELKAMGVNVFFINDGINTATNDGELRLTIMSSMAQDESRKISERVKAGQKISREKHVLYGSGNILGYRRENGTYIPDPDQAETVRLIFQMYSDGEKGLTKIVNELYRLGRLDAGGHVSWDASKVSRVLHNATYKGCICYNKSHSDGYLTQKRVKNLDESSYVYVKGDFEPLVSEEMWDRCQQILLARSARVIDENGKKHKYMRNEFFPITEDLSDGQRKNNLRLQEDLKARYYNAPDLSWVGKNGWRFVNAVSDFATHADPIRKTRNYNENLFLRTAEGNPMIDRAYKMVLAAA